MAEVTQARAGNDGVLLCEFDGRVLELWSNPSQQLANTESLVATLTSAGMQSD